MSSLAVISPRGRLTRGTFVLVVLAIYVLSFLSQILLSAPVINRAGPGWFALAQAALTWAWYVAHVRRLRDAGRGGGMALGIAIVYGLAIVLLLLIVASTTTPSSTTTSPTAPAPKDETTLLSVFFVLYLLATLTGDPTLGALAYLMMAVALVLLTPIFIAFGFSIWTATRRPVAAA